MNDGIGRTLREQIVQRSFLFLSVVLIFMATEPNAHLADAWDDHHPLLFAGEMYSDLVAHDAGAIGRLFRSPFDRYLGRVWPLTRPYFLAVYYFFGFDFHAWKWWNCFLYVISAQLVYTISARLVSHRYAPLLSGIVFLLYFPALLVLQRTCWLETPISPVLCTMFLFLLSMERMAAAPKSNNSSIWMCAVGATLCAAIMLGLKETSLAFVPAVLFLTGCNFWRLRGAFRVPYAFVFSSVVLLACWLVLVVTSEGLSNGEYTKLYQPRSVFGLLANMDVWRQRLLAIYGPLPVFAFVSLVMRVALSLYQRKLSDETKWRITLAIVPLSMIVLLSPQFQQARYYMNSTICMLSILLIWECSDLWGLFQQRDGGTAPRGRGSSWWLVASGALAWTLPAVSQLPHAATIVLKVASLALCGAFLANVIRQERLNWAAHGEVSTRCRNSGRLLCGLCVGHLLLFCIPSILTLIQYMKHNLDTSADITRYLAANVPQDGRVVLNGYVGDWDLESIRVHMANCENRSDIHVVGIDEPEVLPGPADYIVTWDSFRKNRIAVADRRAIHFEATTVVLKVDALQPSYLTAEAALRLFPFLGRQRMGNPDKQLSPIKELFYPDRVQACALCEYQFDRVVYLPNAPGL